MNPNTKQNMNASVDRGKFQLDMYIQPKELTMNKLSGQNKGERKARKVAIMASVSKIVVLLNSIFRHGVLSEAPAA
ncbi:hypothetical protein ACMZOO_02780 [Catenovulum sp. SX2]|uniref:hypothetical protein n=1 Tax=Catenovulum sp. SX2 TaxID=3398614 RepID=UPI003F826A0D